MRQAAVAALGAIVLALPAAGLAAAPPGASARCRDGTYSFSQHRSGTCSHHGGVAQWLGAAGARPAAVAVGKTVVLARRTRAAGCRLGALPDRRCSPGAYYAKLTKAVLCSPGFRTSTIRDVSESEKHAVEVEYGLAPRGYGRTLEIDHVVPLELGGSNDLANLYPEQAALPRGAPGYRVKDELENRLHAMLCAGEIGLRTAQRRIASDWIGLYRSVFGRAAASASVR